LGTNGRLRAEYPWRDKRFLFLI